MRLGKQFHGLLLMFLVSTVLGGIATAEEGASAKGDNQQTEEMPAGEADLLRRIPKKLATLVRIQPEERRLTLRTGSEAEPQSWPVDADAAVRFNAWWGRLEQFTAEAPSAQVSGGLAG